MNEGGRDGTAAPGDRPSPRARERGGATTRTLILDRNLATCQAIGNTISGEPDLQVVEYATSPDEARRILIRDRIDLVVASAHFSAVQLRELRDEVLDRGDRSPLFVLVGVEESPSVILEYLEAGVDAYLVEELSISGLLLTIRLLLRGRALISPRMARLLIERVGELAHLTRRSGIEASRLTELTPREREILDLLGQRLTNAEIAQRLHIEVGTVKSHVHSILQKLEVDSRRQAARYLVVASGRRPQS